MVVNAASERLLARLHTRRVGLVIIYETRWSMQGTHGRTLIIVCRTRAPAEPVWRFCDEIGEIVASEMLVRNQLCVGRGGQRPTPPSSTSISVKVRSACCE